MGLGLSTAGLGPMGPLDPAGLVAVGMATITKSVIRGVASSLVRILTFSKFIRWTLLDVDDATESGIRLLPGPALCERRPRSFNLLRDVNDVADVDVSNSRLT